MRRLRPAARCPRPRSRARPPPHPRRPHRRRARHARACATPCRRRPRARPARARRRPPAVRSPPPPAPRGPRQHAAATRARPAPRRAAARAPRPRRRVTDECSATAGGVTPTRVTPSAVGPPPQPSRRRIGHSRTAVSSPKASAPTCAVAHTDGARRQHGGDGGELAGREQVGQRQRHRSDVASTRRVHGGGQARLTVGRCVCVEAQGGQHVDRRGGDRRDGRCETSGAPRPRRIRFLRRGGRSRSAVLLSAGRPGRCCCAGAFCARPFCADSCVSRVASRASSARTLSCRPVSRASSWAAWSRICPASERARATISSASAWTRWRYWSAARRAAASTASASFRAASSCSASCCSRCCRSFVRWATCSSNRLSRSISACSASCRARSASARLCCSVAAASRDAPDRISAASCSAIRSSRSARTPKPSSVGAAGRASSWARAVRTSFSTASACCSARRRRPSLSASSARSRCTDRRVSRTYSSTSIRSYPRITVTNRARSVPSSAVSGT